MSNDPPGIAMGLSAVLLAAGYGTRLYPLTVDRPKALLPLGRPFGAPRRTAGLAQSFDKSSGLSPEQRRRAQGRGERAKRVEPRVVLDWIVESLHRIPHVRRAVLVTNHRFASQFAAWRRRRHTGLAIVDDGTSDPHTRLGAIRDLLLAIKRVRLQDDDLLVLGTDNLFSSSLTPFVAAAKRRRPAATVALRRAASRRAAKACAVVSRNASRRLTACVEKPANPTSRLIALCLYHFPSPMLTRLQEYVDEGGNPDAPGFFLEWLVPREPVYGTLMTGEWFDIGSLEAYEAAVRRWSPRGRTTLSRTTRQTSRSLT